MAQLFGTMKSTYRQTPSTSLEIQTEMTVDQLQPTSKVALLTGVSGQDGFYLAELSLKKRHIAHYIKRRASKKIRFHRKPQSDLSAVASGTVATSPLTPRPTQHPQATNP
jgi:hypothetical protein